MLSISIGEPSGPGIVPVETVFLVSASCLPRMTERPGVVESTQTDTNSSMSGSWPSGLRPVKGMPIISPLYRPTFQKPPKLLSSS